MIHRVILIAALVVVSFRDLGAQNSDNARFFAAVGIGAAAPTTGGEGIANMAQIVFEKSGHHVALRGLLVHDIERAPYELGEIGVIYGPVTSVNSYPVAIAAGVSGIGFSTCPDDDDSCYTLGVPIVVDASWSGRLVGVGVQGFGNINSKASFAGAVLFLQLGRLNAGTSSRRQQPSERSRYP